MQLTYKKRHVVILVTILVMLLTIMPTGTINKAYAEEDPLLTVDYRTETKMVFESEDFDELDSITATYSSRNSSGVRQTDITNTGATIETIIGAAGIDVESFTTDTSIAFISKNNIERILSWQDISTERFYFSSDGTKGAAVETIISSPTSSGDKMRLYIGQLKSDDRNNSMFFGDIKKIIVNPTVLSICEGTSNNPIKEFALEDLKKIAVDDEDDKTYEYSSYNSYHRATLYDNDKGPTIEGLFEKAGKLLSSLDDDNVIMFISGGDGNSVALTKKQLYDEKRYYFPNFQDSSVEKGGIGNANSVSNKKEVPAIISLKEAGGRLFIGQKRPNEQTAEILNKYMVDRGKLPNGGQIIISSEKAKVLDSVSITPKSKNIAWGDTIDIKDSSGKIQGNTICKIFYTIDKSDPREAAYLYNYQTSGAYSKRTIIVPEGEKTFTVWAYASKYGFPDSDVEKVTYDVVPSKVTGVKATATNHNTVNLSWDAKSKTAGVDGYRVYSSTTKNGSYSLLATVKGTNHNHANLKTGNTYHYKVSTYKDSVESAHSAVVSATPALKKPVSVKATAKSKKIIITAKSVTGATGYEIYKSTKKSSGYKIIKTVKNSSLKYTDKKVKKGKTYYYKVKAYRTVDGKKVYSPFSSVVKKKAK